MEKYFIKMMVLFGLLNFQALAMKEEGEFSPNTKISITKKEKQTKLENVDTSSFSSTGYVVKRQNVEDPFLWQIDKHYKTLVATFKNIANEELISIVNRTIKAIKKHSDFFTPFYHDLLDSLRETIYDWMRTDVLTLGNCYQSQSIRNDSSSSSDEESGEDAWRGWYMQGYNKENSASEDSFSEDNSPSPYCQSEEDSEEGFINWQKNKLEAIFDIIVDSLDEFTPQSLTAANIWQFLKFHMEGGDYSWLINEEVEGYATSYGFVKKYAKEIKAPEHLLNSIFGGLWFEYDWEKVDITDPRFLQKTYIQTLKDFINSSAEHHIKKRIRSSLQKLLLYPENFQEPLAHLQIAYNNAVQKRDWREALVTWSVYSTYRKIFEEENQKKQIIEGPNSFENIVRFKDIIPKFKRTPLFERLKESLERARKHYTKVYPHPTTSLVSYSSRKKPEREAILDIISALSRLKSVGLEVETYRPVERKKQRRNILVPAIYLVVSDRPHVKGGEHKRIFMPIELDVEFLKNRVLTNHSEDGVFDGTDDYYFQQARKDYVKGQMIRGRPQTEAEALFDKARESTISESTNLIHSERVWIELLHDKRVIKSIINGLKEKVLSLFPEGYEGEMKVYSVLSLLYSTNTVCPYCTPSLVALQNSHEEGGFLDLLTKALNKKKRKRFGFKTRGYNVETNQQDPAKFRLHTIVTASTEFDVEARDITNHNSEIKLFFPRNTIDLREELLRNNKQPDPQQRFFHEFVGKNIHTSEKVKFPYSGIVLSSGSNSWSKKIPSRVLH